VAARALTRCGSVHRSAAVLAQRGLDDGGVCAKLCSGILQCEAVPAHDIEHEAAILTPPTRQSLQDVRIRLHRPEEELFVVAQAISSV